MSNQTSAKVTQARATMQQVGANDGVWDANHCYSPTADNGSSVKRVILHFGRPAKADAGGNWYGGYGVLLSKGGYIYSDDLVAQLAEDYIQFWYKNSQSCPRLYLEIGTNNSYECHNDSSCSVYSAGVYWGWTAQRVQAWVNQSGYDWQVEVDGADDIELSAPEYDPYSTTISFVQGWRDNQNYTGYSIPLIDYGDALAPTSGWSWDDVYQVAYGATYDWPLPQIYTACFLASWTTGGACGYSVGLENYDGYTTPIGFLGELTECTQPDQLPDSNCLSGSSVQDSWKQAWNALWSKQATLQASLNASVNIQDVP